MSYSCVWVWIVIIFYRKKIKNMSFTISIWFPIVSFLTLLIYKLKNNCNILCYMTISGLILQLQFPLLLPLVEFPEYKHFLIVSYMHWVILLFPKKLIVCVPNVTLNSNYFSENVRNNKNCSLPIMYPLWMRIFLEHRVCTATCIL